MAYVVSVNGYDLPSATQTTIYTVPAAMNGNSVEWALVVGDVVALGWFDNTYATLKGVVTLLGPGDKASLGPFATGDQVVANCYTEAARLTGTIAHV